MKRNIVVFLILILLVSSLKFGSKARETNRSLLPEKLSGMVDLKSDNETQKAGTFEEAVNAMQEANKALANGNKQPFRSVWLQNQDATIFGEDLNGELKGWKAIDSTLNALPQPRTRLTDYSYEKITSQEGENQAYLVQEEHYRFADGTTKDLQVTILFQRRNNDWKIIHRHADHISLTAVSSITK